MTPSGHPLEIWKAQVVFIRTSVPELPKTGEHFTQKMGLCGLPVKGRELQVKGASMGVFHQQGPHSSSPLRAASWEGEWGSWQQQQQQSWDQEHKYFLPGSGEEKLQRTNYSVMRAVMKGGAFYYQCEASERGMVKTWFISSLNNFWESVPFLKTHFFF